jgi:hypothetical protein
VDVVVSSTPASTCPECGAALPVGTTCRDIFERMLALEFGHPETFGAVHHLTVLCYNVQHPGAFTDEFWDYSAALLTEVIERDISGAELRQRMRHELAAGNRRIKIKGRPTKPRRYPWPMRAVDVPMDHPQRYVERVREWARSIVGALHQPHAPTAPVGSA